jgi:hypothetical protein
MATYTFPLALENGQALLLESGETYLAVTISDGSTTTSQSLAAHLTIAGLTNVTQHIAASLAIAAHATDHLSASLTTKQNAALHLGASLAIGGVVQQSLPASLSTSRKATDALAAHLTIDGAATDHLAAHLTVKSSATKHLNASLSLTGMGELPIPQIVQQNTGSTGVSPFYVQPHADGTPAALGNLVVVWMGWSTYHGDNALTPTDSWTTLVADNPASTDVNGLLAVIVADGTTGSYEWSQVDPDTVNWWCAEIGGWDSVLGHLIANSTDNFSTTDFLTGLATPTESGMLALSFFTQDAFSNVIFPASDWSEIATQGSGYYFGIEVQKRTLAPTNGVAVSGAATYDNPTDGVGAILLIPHGTPHTMTLNASLKVSSTVTQLLSAHLTIAGPMLVLTPPDDTLPYNETQVYKIRYVYPDGDEVIPTGIFTTSAGTMDPAGITSSGEAILIPDEKIGDYEVGFTEL